MKGPIGDRDGSAVSWGEPIDGLRLGLAANGGLVELRLQNVGRTSLEVLSYVDAGEVHLDWYTLNLRDEQGDLRRLTLLDDRDESGIVRAQLAPGKDLRHSVDLVGWAGRDINSHRPLTPGSYQLSAVYDAPPRGNNWTGKLEAGPIAWTL